MNHRSKDRLRVAFLREGNRLSRKPFQIAMLAHMNNSMHFLSFPQESIKSQIAVRRDQVRIVIAGCRVNIITPGGLYADNDVAMPVRRQFEFALVYKGIIFGLSPTFQYRRLQGAGQLFKKVFVRCHGIGKA